MAIIKCKMCGGDMELSPDKTLGTCEYCGSTMTLPKLDDQQRAAAFDRGNHFRRLGEFDKALSVYERIIQEDENDAEAHWCCALCRFGIEYVKDPVSGEYLPTCHRASFDSFLEDVDCKAALEHADPIARRQYEKDAEQIAAVQRGILSTVQKEEPFDVFICYKEADDNGQRTVDSALAQDIYYQLTEQGRRVFFARITLEDKAGQEYEPYIFAALNSAKVMVVVGTNPENLNSVWVKNEWSRYLALMKNDRKRLLLPCYRDMDPYDLPEQLSILQAYDMSKIGFIQDLIRGINKVLDADKKPEAVKETVIVQNEGNANLTALLKRGNMALEDGEWDRADEFFEQSLNIDAECAQAYFGKALAAQKCHTTQELVEKRTAVSARGTAAVACEKDAARMAAIEEKYKLPLYLSGPDILTVFSEEADYRTYTVFTQYWQGAIDAEHTFWERDKLLSRAVRFDRQGSIAIVRDEIYHFLENKLTEAKTQDEAECQKCIADYAKYLDEMEQKVIAQYELVCQKRENDYQAACRDMKLADTWGDYRRVEHTFLSLGEYKNSAELATQCREKTVQLEAEEAKAREEAERAKVETKRKQRKRRIKIASVIVVMACVLGTLTKFLFIPMYQYKTAEKILEAGDTAGAAFAFARLGNYQDARERSFALWDEFAVRETVSAGDHHTVGLKSDSTVVAVGSNDDGQCNVGDWKDIVAVSAGFCHTVGLKSDGSVVAVGYDDNGQCNVSDWTDIVAISAGGFHTVGLKSDGTVMAVGYGEYGQCNVSDWTDIVAISAGGSHTVGLKSDGTVVAVGYDEYGQCNVSDWTGIVAVSAGDCHTVGLKPAGTVVAVGSSDDGRCNVSDWTDIVAISAGVWHTVGLKTDGTIVAVGDNIFGRCDVSGWTDIVAVSAGKYHTVGLKSDGTVVAVGSSDYGRCNVSDWTGIKLP